MHSSLPQAALPTAAQFAALTAQVAALPTAAPFAALSAQVAALTAQVAAALPTQADK